MNPRVACLLGLALPLAIGGCAVVGAGYVVTTGAAIIAGSDRSATIGDRSIQKEYPRIGNISYSIVPYNWRGTEKSANFVVAVDFWRNDRKTFGSIGVDLSKFELVLSDGTYRASGYVVKYAPRVSQGCIDGHANHAPPRFVDRPESHVTSLPGPPITLRSWVEAKSFLSECVDVVFPVHWIGPDAQFTIKVDGLTYDGSELPASSVEFKKGYGTWG